MHFSSGRHFVNHRPSSVLSHHDTMVLLSMVRFRRNAEVQWRFLRNNAAALVASAGTPLHEDLMALVHDTAAFEATFGRHLDFLHSPRASSPHWGATALVALLAQSLFSFTWLVDGLEGDVCPRAQPYLLYVATEAALVGLHAYAEYAVRRLRQVHDPVIHDSHQSVLGQEWCSLFLACMWGAVPEDGGTEAPFALAQWVAENCLERDPNKLGRAVFGLGRTALAKRLLTWALSRDWVISVAEVDARITRLSCGGRLFWC